HVLATANGGNYPVSAMRLYVDNQTITTINKSKMDLYTPLSSGSHYIVVVAWNTIGKPASSSATVTVGDSGKTSVNISSPGTTSNSPMHVVASATPASGRSITSIAVYVDNQLKTHVNGSQIDTYISASQGTHNTVVQCWDNLGVVTKNSVQVNVTTGNGDFAKDFSATSNWLATQVSHTGALLYSTERINPYYANLAAMGLVKDPARYVQVENWMRWYISHLNRNDKWGLGGTMYDYNIVNGNEVSSGDADSTDSYAATFLSVAYAYFATGNPAAQAYVRSIASDIDLIGHVLAKTQQSDGLTWAKPDYQIKYLMDNAEVFRGLADAATLFGSMGDAAKQNYYTSLATKCQSGVWSMWMNGKWAVYKDGIGRLIGPNMATWYPDASAQMFPVLYGVVPGNDSRAKQAYDYFNKAWPGWPQLSYSKQDPFPWVMVADAAMLMGDSGRVGTYANSVRSKWVNKGFPWTWYSMEAGWYLRMAAYMDGDKNF
ncbi:MAG: hypothetical protein ACXVZX_13675, partial [Terriglobales bacterium]